MRIELTTSSLPRKCSTPELQRPDKKNRFHLLIVFIPIQKVMNLFFLFPLFQAKSGRRGSNSPPIAWKAIALPNELLPLEIVTATEPILFRFKELFYSSKKKNNCGQEWIRTTEVERQRIYSPPHLAALEPAQYIF